jgi:hypothetical protein
VSRIAFDVNGVRWNFASVAAIPRERIMPQISSDDAAEAGFAVAEGRAPTFGGSRSI